MTEIGARIVAVRDANDTTVNIYGRGAYAGDFPRPGSGNWHPDDLRMAEGAIRSSDNRDGEDETWVRDFNARMVAEGKVTQGEADVKLADYRAGREAERARPMAERVDALLWGMAKNPRMDLDGGGTVWGCECWWMPEAKFEAFRKGRDVVEVPEPNRSRVTQ